MNQNNENDNKTSSPDEKMAGSFYCKTCKREHDGNLDGPGHGHWPFSKETMLKSGSKMKPVPSKAQIMYDLLLQQPRVPLFVPLEGAEKPGTLAFCQLNGLKIGVYKGTYVDVPKQVAEIMRTSLNQTSRIPFDAVTAPNPFTGEQRPANLAMRDSVSRDALNA